MRSKLWISVAVVCAMATADPGPYSLPIDDPENTTDAPIPGFVGPNGDGKTGTSGPDNYVNPLFFDWASTVVDYTPFGTVSTDFQSSAKALGPVTGDHFDVVSLGDMTQPDIDSWLTDPENQPGPGSLTVTFETPIVDKSGADFVIFENGFISGFSTPQGSVSGSFFAEFAYVEVSANGVDFYRFASDADTPSPVGSYGTVDATNVTNLAGKHANANGDSWGTPFDLAELGLSSITHIRVVDIPGSGDFTDASGDPIHDSWFTFGSGGADIEAFGVISTNMVYANWPQLQALDPAERDPEDDPDLDGVCNLAEYAFATLPGSADAAASMIHIECAESENGMAAVIQFRRDERLTDISYELQVTTDLTPPVVWTPIATSVAGGSVNALPGQTLDITESSASEIATVGVIRTVKVTDLSPGTGPRFYRIAIKQSP